jgi:hypothetical protein
MSQSELRLRIVVIDPPSGVAFAVQRGRSELLPPARQTSEEMVFDFSVRVADPNGSEPNFLGPYAQGPVGERFVYINSGQRAEEAQSCWDRRAKVHLRDIGWPLVKKALASGGVLEARIEGTGRDGGPACATVPLLGGGWRFVA